MENCVNVDSRVTYFEMAHIPCAIFNKNMMLADINNNALQTFHLKSEDIVHKKLIDIFPHIESSENYEAYLQVIETRNPIDDKVKLIYKGKEYFFLVRAFKIGEGLGLSGIDTTENISNLKKLGTTLSQLDIVHRKLNGRDEELDWQSYVRAHEVKTH